MARTCVVQDPFNRNDVIENQFRPKPVNQLISSNDVLFGQFSSHTVEYKTVIIG